MPHFIILLYFYLLKRRFVTAQNKESNKGREKYPAHGVLDKVGGHKWDPASKQGINRRTVKQSQIRMDPERLVVLLLVSFRYPVFCQPSG